MDENLIPGVAGSAKERDFFPDWIAEDRFKAEGDVFFEEPGTFGLRESCGIVSASLSCVPEHAGGDEVCVDEGEREVTQCACAQGGLSGSIGATEHHEERCVEGHGFPCAGLVIDGGCGAGSSVGEGHKGLALAGAAGAGAVGFDADQALGTRRVGFVVGLLVKAKAGAFVGCG